MVDTCAAVAGRYPVLRRSTRPSLDEAGEAGNLSKIGVA